MEDLFFDVAQAAIQSTRLKQVQEEYDLMEIQVRRKYRRRFASELLNGVKKIPCESDAISALVKRLRNHLKTTGD